MGKTLVIAEKPSVGRDYAKVLGCTGRGDGCLIGDRYVVTWAVGHLVELSPPERYDSRYKRWSYRDLPIMPERIRHEVIASSKKQYEIVKSWMNSDQITHIICGTDSDKFLINDCNSYTRSNQSWDFDTFKDEIRNLWAFSYDE